MEKITVDWLKTHYQMIHAFGLVFIQIKLNFHERVHIYSPVLNVTSSEEEIHDHRYDFTSKVIHGALVNKIYQLTEGDDHLLTFENCKMEKEERKEQLECGVKLLVVTDMRAGTIYTMTHDTLHRLESPGAVTFLTRKSPIKDLARVVYQKGKETVCPFSVNRPEDELWQIVSEELKIYD